MRNFYLSLIVLLAVCLSSCIEMAEIIEIKTDNSIDYTLMVSIPEMPKDKKKGKGDKGEEIEKEVEEFFSQTSASGLKFLGKEEKDQNGLKIIGIKLNASSLKELNKIYSIMEKKSKEKAKRKSSGKKKDDDPFSQILGKSAYRVQSSKDGVVKVVRSFKPPKIKKKKAKDPKKEKMSKEIQEALMNSFRYRFEVFLPSQPLANNADQVFERNLRWEATLGYLLKAPFSIEFSYQAEKVPAGQ